MAYLPLEKLLLDYFQRPELQNACDEIDEPTSPNNPELITTILNEWENKGNDKYELFEYLKGPILSRICKAYKIDHKGGKEVLLKRIRNKKLLDNTHTTIKIGSGIGGGAVFTFILFLLSPFYSDFIEQLNPLETGDSKNAVLIITNFGEITINQNPLSESEFQDVEDLNLFIDNESGFKIEKPNQKWFFVKDIDAYGRSLGLETHSSFIGGVFVNRINTVQTGVMVFQSSEIETLDIGEHIEKVAIESARELGTDIKILDKVVSTDNNYGYIETHFTNSTHERYDFRIVQKLADKLYILHVNSFIPEDIPEDVSEEINFVVNSFRIIS